VLVGGGLNVIVPDRLQLMLPLNVTGGNAAEATPDPTVVRSAIVSVTAIAARTNLRTMEVPFFFWYVDAICALNSGASPARSFQWII